uniref:Secretoglobin family 1A member 1 n=1 Tax=Pelusios castaneus TaxID=367368 RepID=A0A8C8RYV3_9SAUR
GMILLNSVSCVCIPATADPCPSLSNVLNKYLFGSLPEYLQSIAPFVTRDVMNAAAYELKGCVLNLSKEHSEAIEELMVTPQCLI